MHGIVPGPFIGESPRPAWESGCRRIDIDSLRYDAQNRFACRHIRLRSGYPVISRPGAAGQPWRPPQATHAESLLCDRDAKPCARFAYRPYVDRNFRGTVRAEGADCPGPWASPPACFRAARHWRGATLGAPFPTDFGAAQTRGRGARAHGKRLCAGAVSSPVSQRGPQGRPPRHPSLRPGPGPSFGAGRIRRGGR